MADTVSTQTLTDTTGVKFAVKMTNYSDGTGETLVKKVDASNTTFMTEDGNRKISKITLTPFITSNYHFHLKSLNH